MQSRLQGTSATSFPLLLFGGVTVAGSALALIPCLEYGWNETGTQLAARYTARFSVLLFILVFIARPLHQSWRSQATRTLLRRRRQFGLAFALAHGIHLLAIVSFFVASGTWFSSGDIPAGVAYVFIALLAVTSNDATMRRLGRWWKRLHRTGIYVIFLTFAVAYGGRVFGGYAEVAEEPALPSGSYPAHLAVFTLLMGGLLLRAVAALRTRPQRTASA